MTVQLIVVSAVLSGCITEDTMPPGGGGHLVHTDREGTNPQFTTLKRLLFKPCVYFLLNYLCHIVYEYIPSVHAQSMFC